VRSREHDFTAVLSPGGITPGIAGSQTRYGLADHWRANLALMEWDSQMKVALRRAFAKKGTLLVDGRQTVNSDRIPVR
jgi:hypothetical protein